MKKEKLLFVSYGLVRENPCGVYTILIACGRRAGAGGIYDSKVRDWHIYTYWEHVLDRRTVAADGLPWSAVPAGELPKYSPNMCPRTLDLLARSVHIEINHHYREEDCQAIARGINKVFHHLLS